MLSQEIKEGGFGEEISRKFTFRIYAGLNKTSGILNLSLPSEVLKPLGNSYVFLGFPLATLLGWKGVQESF